MSQPLVTIVTATRNRPGTLARALQSIASQTYENFEALIIDDGSDEATLDSYRDVWKDLDDRFLLRPVRTPADRRGTPAVARNRGIRLAKGHFITFLDDDDTWTTADHLAVSVESLTRWNADYYFANMRSITHTGDVFSQNWFAPFEHHLKVSPLAECPALYDVRLGNLMRVMRHCVVHPNMALVRRDLMNQVGGFCERVVFAEDYELMMRLQDRARRIIYRAEPIGDYSLPSANSHSSRVQPGEQILDRITATLNIRRSCRQAPVRRSARAREAWAYRELSKTHLSDRQWLAASAFAWQGLCLFPTLGGLADLCTTVARSCLASLRKRLPNESAAKQPRAETAGGCKVSVQERAI